MNYIFIYLLIIIIINYFNVVQRLNTYYNINYLSALTQCDYKFIESFYNISQKYSSLENLIVESSIKITHGNYNNHRYTIPIYSHNFVNNDYLLNFCNEICPFKQNEIKKVIYEYIKCSLDNLSINSETDIIIGYDLLYSKYKVYINSHQKDMECIEINYVNLNVKKKLYRLLLSNNYQDIKSNLNDDSLLLLSILNLNEDNYEIIYRVNVNTYHILLKNPYKLNEYQINFIENYFGLDLSKWIQIIKYKAYLIYVISVQINLKNIKNIEHINLYMRPNHLITKVTRTIKYMGALFFKN